MRPSVVRSEPNQAGGAIALPSLQCHVIDLFAGLSEMASESDADIGFLNSAILANAVNEYLGAVLSATTTTSDPSDMPPIEVTLTPHTDRLVFELLRKGQAAPFRVLAPDPRAVQPGASRPADPESLPASRMCSR